MHAVAALTIARMINEMMRLRVELAGAEARAGPPAFGAPVLRCSDRR